MIDRRRVLHALGASLAVPIAGCGSTVGSVLPGSEPTGTPPVNTLSFEEMSKLDYDLDPSSYVRELSVGQLPSEPEWLEAHDVRVWNETGASLAAGITLENRTDETTPVDRTFDLAADEAVKITLNGPATYYATVTDTGLGEQETFSVPERVFDCNASSTDVIVLEDGRIEALYGSFMVACPDSG